MRACVYVCVRVCVCVCVCMYVRVCVYYVQYFIEFSTIQFDFDTRSLNTIQNGNRINKSDFADIIGYSSEVSHRSAHHPTVYMLWDALG